MKTINIFLIYCAIDLLLIVTGLRVTSCNEIPQVLSNTAITPSFLSLKLYPVRRRAICISFKILRLKLFYIPQLLSISPSLCPSRVLCAASHWQTTSCLHFSPRTPWRTTWRDDVCCQMQQIRPAPAGPEVNWHGRSRDGTWRPSDDKASIDSNESRPIWGGFINVSMEPPANHKSGRALESCRKSSGLRGNSIARILSK